MSATMDEEPPAPRPIQILAALLHSVALNGIALVLMLLVVAPFMSVGLALMCDWDEWAFRMLGFILVLGPLAATIRVWLRLMVN